VFNKQEWYNNTYNLSFLMCNVKRMRLISPSTIWQKEFILFARQFQKEKKFSYYQGAIDNFDLYVAQLKNEENNIDLTFSPTPCSHYWLINNNNEIIGVTRIRHHVTTANISHDQGHIAYDISPQFRKKGLGIKILQLALKKAKQLSLKKVIVATDLFNIASRKIIEKNQGIPSEIKDSYYYSNTIIKYTINIK